MSEPAVNLRAALERLLDTLNHRLDYYEEEFEILNRACQEGYGLCPCTDTRRTRHYLIRLQRELAGLEDVESLAQAIRRAALLIHASNSGEPILQRLLQG